MSLQTPAQPRMAAQPTIQPVRSLWKYSLFGRTLQANVSNEISVQWTQLFVFSTRAPWLRSCLLRLPLETSSLQTSRLAPGYRVCWPAGSQWDLRSAGRPGGTYSTGPDLVHAGPALPRLITVSRAKNKHRNFNPREKLPINTLPSVSKCEAWKCWWNPPDLISTCKVKKKGYGYELMSTEPQIFREALEAVCW